MKQSQLELATRINDQTTTRKIVTVELVNGPERIPRAIKKTLLCWLIAVLCVLIPVLHFVLVPLFFLLGLVVGFRTLKSSGRLLACELVCPKCQTAILIKSRELHWPITESCPACGIQTRSEPVD